MTDERILPAHFARFGSHNEQVHFSGDLKETYEGLVFNANLVAWSSAGIAGFVCEQNLIAKSYFIDPLTHAFQHQPSVLTNDDDELKPSILKLVEEFGDPVKKIAGQGALLPNDLDDEGLCRSFTERVLEFQWSTLHREATETDAWPILEFQYTNPTFRPNVLIAPYFFMKKATFRDWLSKNTEFVKLAIESDYDAPIAAQLVIAKEVLVDEGARDRLINEYSKIDADLVFLWVDELSEHDASVPELEALFELICGLAEKNKQVINLYGGFFSILLNKPDVGPLAGVCHGPQYGEDRGVVPVGGGLPTARFYVRAVHHRVRFADALRLFRNEGWLKSRETYIDNICSCPQCRALIDDHGVEKGFLKYGESKIVTFERGGTTVSRKFPLRDTQVAATAHYMYAKEDEFKTVDTYTVDVLQRRLSKASKKFRRILGDGVAHLSNWESVIGGMDESKEDGETASPSSL